MDNFFPRRKRAHIFDLNIVPILDMFVSVIFFLLLSTSFLAITKNTLPPSGTKTISDPKEAKPPPLSPKMALLKDDKEYKLYLYWFGDKPGTEEVTKEAKFIDEDPKNLLETAKEMFKKFSEANKGEKTIQISMGSDVEYQKLMSLMDAARDFMPDVVLFSPEEAEVVKTRQKARSSSK